MLKSNCSLQDTKEVLLFEYGLWFSKKVTICTNFILPDNQ